MMKHLYLFIISNLIIICFSVSSLYAANIGIVFDGPSPLNAELLRTYKQEITELVEGKFTVTFPEDKILTSDWTTAGVKRNINTLLSDPEVEILITLGLVGSTEIANRKSIPKPVIAPWIIDKNIVGLSVNDKGASGVRNLYFLSTHPTFDRDLKVFKEIVGFKKMALLYMPILTEIVPQIEQYALSVGKQNDIDIYLIPIKSNISETLSQLPADTEAVFVTPLLNYQAPEIIELYEGLIEKGLPSFTMLGKDGVYKGALMGLKPEIDVKRRAQRIALVVQSILRGENAGDIPVDLPIQEQLTINMATARAINFYPQWRGIIDAVLINEFYEGKGRVLTIEQAVNESVKVNLDLLAAEQFVAAGAQDIKLAMSELLPQSDLFLDTRFIDKDRAEASLGTQAQRSLSGSANLSQLIYSENAWSNLTVQRRLQNARQFSRDTVRLDIMAATAIGYLNLLRAKSIEQIQRDNLTLSKSNLEIAKVRRDKGVASPGEVFRWESEISSDRIEVVNTEAERKNSAILINRLLHRPQGEEFTTVESGLRDKRLIVSDPRLKKYVNNPESYRVFFDFMVNEGLTRAPIISRLNSEISAQERILTSTQRAFWLPTLSAFGGITQFMYEGGAGSDVDVGDLPIPLAPTDDTEWVVSFQASFPLFRGGAKIADYKQARSEVSRLTLERDSAKTKVEEAIRTSLNEAGASFRSIKFARDAADAAHKNLELVSVSYSRGVVSIIDLLDAQNAALSADLNAINAVYDFIIDLINVQRAAGKTDFFTTPRDKDEWFNRLEKFSREHEEQLNK